MPSCASVATPLPQQLNRKQQQSALFANPKYFRSLAEHLQYLTLTRPDLQFSVNYVCQKMHEPIVSDFNLLKRILRYIKGTTTMSITFDKNTDYKLTAYSDSDYAGCQKSSRSTGGFCTFLGRNMISWSSRKQDTVSKSSTEAEYRAMSKTASKITWLVAFGNLIVNHIPADYQLANIFTKSLPQRPFEILRLKLGVGVPHTPSDVYVPPFREKLALVSTKLMKVEA
ncbi:PREDICTED: uncharacterized protein LOC109131245 [Camelina sativa]|uniref:Uncharacterized protein LOC109131245 n=1 Tax=Camelina sativa TaxID=90675 RepID=A0ABM1REQ0_CAMSA|nr:PREDICTED: uncharacterized protein LOC109131245 [Camelina sativa]